MPTVTLNKTVFEGLVGKSLPLEELKERISMLGTDLEGIEGEEITVEIFPNRPDLLSEQGFARAFSSFIGVKKGLRNYEIKNSGHKVLVDPSVTMRPYTACAIVKNITFTTEKIREIMQTQEKLATTHGRNRKKSGYGIYPATKIHFPLTYSAKDPKEVIFTPLGFNEAMTAEKVAEIHPKAKEYQNITKDWEKYPFFIDAQQNVLSMLPYTNSQDTGKVDLSTQDIFVECSGSDLSNVQVALNILVTMFADMGGKIYSLEMEYPDKILITPDLTPARMRLDLASINKLLGLDLKQEEAVDLLSKMGFGFDHKQQEVLVPAYRDDILHQVDLAEDIAIAYGYENITEEIPRVATIGEEDPFEKFFNKVREILIGLELLEVKNYHLLMESELTEMMNLAEPAIAIRNAVGEHNHLRNSLLPSLLKNLRENMHQEYPQNLFEIGRTFTRKENIDEVNKLAVILSDHKTDYTKIRQILEALFQSLGLEGQVKELAHPSFILGRVGEIILKGKSIGLIGDFHPQVLENWDLVTPTVGFELDLQEVFHECFRNN